MSTKTEPPSTTPGLYVDSGWVCNFLGVNEHWIRRRVKMREIPFHKFGGLIRFNRYEIERWAVEQRIPPRVEFAEEWSWDS